MMKTVAWAFEQFIQRLELSGTEAAAATRQQQEVVLRVQQQLRPQESMLSGSYGRHTAIRPLHDIDLFLIFPTDTVPPRPAAHDYLRHVLHALQAAYPMHQPRLQNRSVNIEFKDSGIGFDVVPAMETPRQQGIYWIPDRSRDMWICSNPRRHWETCHEANERMSKKLKPLIKALKRWNQLQNKPVSSFHLEVMAAHCLVVEPQGYASGLANLFQLLSERIQRLMPEPAGLGPPVDNDLDTNHREQARQRLAGAASKAARALDCEQRGDLATAHMLWHGLLGDDYQGG